MSVWIPILSAVVAGLASLVVSVLANRTHWATLRAEYGTEQSAEAAIHNLLALDDLPYRSFQMIRHHVGGFESNELRRLLVRAGAVRFMAADGTELWALRERVKQDYQRSRWKHPESPRNKVPPSELFPGAFGNSTDH